ncbi:MAG: RHS repeat-associated core domain-containing protein, partial [Acidimicrobiales bacterium]|nr:RHS repeat-associated core domain-containing protein [Acidimicrobiales bacterium]
AGPHAVTQYGSDDFTYDDNGNMITRDIPGDTQTLAWDDDHQLESVTDTSGTTSFLYDADGNRVKRTTGSESTVYVGGVYEYTTAGATTTETSYYTFAGRTVAVRNGSDLHYLAQDHLGSTSLTRDGSSGAVAVHRYNPFGDPRGTSAPTETDHTYTGQIADSATDLMFYNARYYDPGIARFISPDTIVPNPANPQDLNRYTYVRNNPTNHTDPTGHDPDESYLCAGRLANCTDDSFNPVSHAVQLAAACQRNPHVCEIRNRMEAAAAELDAATRSALDRALVACRAGNEGYCVAYGFLDSGAITPSQVDSVAGIFCKWCDDGVAVEDPVTQAVVEAPFVLGATAAAERLLVRLAARSVASPAAEAAGAQLIDDTVRGLAAGRSPGVSVVNSADELDDLYRLLSVDGTPVSGSTYPGKLVKLPDGSTVGIRPISRSGGPTIDIKLSDGHYLRIHVQQ